MHFGSSGPATITPTLELETGTMFDSPCPYATLKEYDWHLGPGHYTPAGCPNFRWNPVVYSLLAAFESSTLTMAAFSSSSFFTYLKGGRSCTSGKEEVSLLGV